MKSEGVDVLSIIGCGNLNRCDDGAGVLVVRELTKHLKLNPVGNVRIFDAGTNGMAVMFEAKQASKIIIIDVSKTDSDPGTIFEVPGSEFVGKSARCPGQHEFRWDHAIYVGRKIFRGNFPSDVTVYLIEAGILDFGARISREVNIAIDTVSRKIIREINEYEKSFART